MWAHCEVSSRVIGKAAYERPPSCVWGRIDARKTTAKTATRCAVSSMTTMMAYQSISRWSGALGICAIVAVIRPAHADPRAVVELFTSQGCSSCPPADKIIGELAKDPSIIALSMPIDYWDYLGWKDTLADSRFTARQKAYSQMRGDREVYTPQAVDQRLGACDRQRSRRHRKRDRRDRQDRRRDVGAGVDDAGRQADQCFGRGGQQGPAASHGEVWICSISKAVPIAIGRGENRGREITYHNVVRNLLKVGDWNGSPEAGPCRSKTSAREGVDARRGLCPGRQSRQARPDAGRGLHVAALNPLQNSDRHSRLCHSASGRASASDCGDARGAC